jgi:hypothetical protein
MQNIGKDVKYKYYAISPPDSEWGNRKLYFINKLKLFCNGKGLHDSTMLQVALGGRTQHKGWKCGYIRHSGILYGIRIQRNVNGVPKWWYFKNESCLASAYNYSEHEIRENLNGNMNTIECERIHLQYKLEHKQGKVYFPDDLVEFITMANKVCSESKSITLKKIRDACILQTNEYSCRFIKDTDWKVYLVPVAVKKKENTSEYIRKILSCPIFPTIEIHSLFTEALDIGSKKRNTAEEALVSDLFTNCDITEIAHDEEQAGYEYEEDNIFY